jgi:hypothetical protein
MIIVYVNFSARASENQTGIFGNFPVLMKQKQNILKKIIYVISVFHKSEANSLSFKRNLYKTTSSLDSVHAG